MNAAEQTSATDEPAKCEVCLGYFSWAELARPGACIDCDAMLQAQRALATDEAHSAKEPA